MDQNNLRMQTAWLVCSILFAGAAIRGQVSTGSIAGRVTDPAQAVMPAAAVTLTNQETGAKKAVKTAAKKAAKKAVKKGAKKAGKKVTKKRAKR